MRSTKTDDWDEELRKMAAQGIVRLPEESPDLDGFFALPASKISVAKLKAAAEAERREDW